MQDAKEILEFNKFMRKRLMEFYRLTKCPVPHSSMLFKRRKSFQISSERSRSTGKDFITGRKSTAQPTFPWTNMLLMLGTVHLKQYHNDFRMILQPSI